MHSCGSRQGLPWALDMFGQEQHLLLARQVQGLPNLRSSELWLAGHFLKMIELDQRRERRLISTYA